MGDFITQLKKESCGDSPEKIRGRNADVIDLDDDDDGGSNDGQEVVVLDQDVLPTAVSAQPVPSVAAPSTVSDANQALYDEMDHTALLIQAYEES